VVGEVPGSHRTMGPSRTVLFRRPLPAANCCRQVNWQGRQFTKMPQMAFDLGTLYQSRPVWQFGTF